MSINDNFQMTGSEVSELTAVHFEQNALRNLTTACKVKLWTCVEIEM
jgi:hypothetical protein